MCGSMEDAAELTRRWFLRGTLGAALDGGNYMRVFRQAVAARRA
jgi:hypothetical protein